MESDGPWPAVIGGALVVALIVSAVPQGGCLLCIPLFLAIAVVWALSQS